ncbi:hypothetical protein PSTT_16390 [Puccinia striiformis]|uniref:Uncharacterized protein n=1 Tax=Puccinia striiformis TaxID=27350 RepID=A0A2S4UD71_9BASI|nr:hypothetical protein PSTT_16390 [Puccinia striiformis]
MFHPPSDFGVSKSRAEDENYSKSESSDLSSDSPCVNLPQGNSEIICQESVIPGPRADNKQILCEIRKDEYYACEMSNCNSGKGSPSTNPFSKMTWQKCGQPTATGAPGPQDRTVTGTLNYGVEHENGLMGVRGTEPGVSGDHYYQCSLSQNPQRSHCTGCQYVNLGGLP